MADEFKAEESMAHESMADEFKPKETNKIHDHSDGAGKGRRDRKAPKAASHDATLACKKI